MVEEVMAVAGEGATTAAVGAEGTLLLRSLSPWDMADQKAEVVTVAAVEVVEVAMQRLPRTVCRLRSRSSTSRVVVPCPTTGEHEEAA